MKEVLHRRSSPGPSGIANPKARQLALRKQLLDIIRQRRESEGNSTIGTSIEKWILAQELNELEKLVDKESR